MVLSRSTLEYIADYFSLARLMKNQETTPYTLLQTDRY